MQEKQTQNSCVLAEGMLPLSYWYLVVFKQEYSSQAWHTRTYTAKNTVLSESWDGAGLWGSTSCLPHNTDCHLLPSLGLFLLGVLHTLPHSSADMTENIRAWTWTWFQTAIYAIRRRRRIKAGQADSASYNNLIRSHQDRTGNFSSSSGTILPIFILGLESCSWQI